jgi:hypothetical protein
VYFSISRVAGNIMLLSVTTEEASIVEAFPLGSPERAPPLYGSYERKRRGLAETLFITMALAVFHKI